MFYLSNKYCASVHSCKTVMAVNGLLEGLLEMMMPVRSLSGQCELVSAGATLNPYQCSPSLLLRL